MFREAAEAPAAVGEQLRLNETAVRDLARRLRATPPRALVTIGRGSSDNAATFARYLVETRLEILAASAAPSVSSVYDAAPAMEGAVALVISQSGASPDLIAAARAAASAGALVVALVNDPSSPLAAAAQVVIPLRAGTERSVAATKSFIAALAAIVQLAAHWTQDSSLIAALAGLPDLLARAWALDWSACLPLLGRAQHLYVVGRGPGFAIAQEAALKFKETSGLHAEAFSAAEVRHGPMALVGPGFPVLALAQDDETRESVEAAVGAFAAQGAQVLAAGLGAAEGGVRALPVLAAHPLLQPIAQAQSFYRMVEALARARGFDPDHPAHLAKVTRTL
jgi:glucosamine--fructose-6-phosphate aminotransferase (isomerizing)